jgi:hypothetical protein
MTSAPNIEMIASSLRNCSLNGGSRRRVRHQDHDEGSDDSEGITVELNSEVSLPYHWQQCLDIRVRTRSPAVRIDCFIPWGERKRERDAMDGDRRSCVRAWPCVLSQSFVHKWLTR